jgi:hypothetical protein
MTFTEIVKKYSRLGESLVEVVASPQAFSLSAVHKGLLFVLAPWSAQSIQAFQALTHALSELARLPPVFAVSIDDLKNHGSLRKLERSCEGKGEVFWIAGGKLVHALTLSGADSVRAAVEYTHDLAKNETRDDRESDRR